MTAAPGPSQRRKTAAQILETYNVWDLDQIMSYRAEDCVHEILPKALKMPDMDNATYRTYFGGMMPHYRNFRVEAHDFCEDEADNKIVVHASSSAETDIGPYSNEYMLTLIFNEAGDKIVRMKEFVDSRGSAEFTIRLREHLAKAEGS
ncbi:hypothetical protein GQ53DRAFT_751190 [Thozetella sp. PMI_491]|nr:hypothetical protein GQ53DRAFT_751190 [Thozetella sp. PMI_491]